MDSESFSSKIEKLSETNFHAWKQKIKHLLALKDLSEFIEESSPSDDSDKANWKRKDRKAQAIIGLTLSDDILENVRDVESTKDMWQKICDVFERHTLLNKLSARKKFYTALKEENESALQFSNRVRQLASTLKSMKVNVDESEMAMALLNGLPTAYDPLISALDALHGEKDDLKFDYVKSRVLQEEQRIEKRIGQDNAKSEASALVSNQRQYRRDRPKCNFCGRLGHVESKCWKKHPHLNPHNKTVSKDPAAFVAAENEEDFVCLLAKHSKYAEDSIQTEKSSNWYIDSGCSNHMTHDKSLFSSYTAISRPSSVELGNGNKTPIQGAGTVHVRIKVHGASKLCILTDVYYVPELGYNLMSVPTLDKKGLSTTFSNKKCHVSRQGTLLATGSMFGNLYKIDIDSSIPIKSRALTAQSLDIWHQRLAHIDPSTIQRMSNNRVVNGIELKRQESPTPCAHCIAGKGHRTPFPQQSRTMTSELLELIHSDVKGPIEIQSHGGSRYFITFIDDFSKWTTVYPMKEKSESFQCFKKFHKFAETHSGQKLKILRTDNGGEYTSNEFQNYLEQNGIVHQPTVAYSPQQNGVAERMNRTLMDLVRSMLHAKNMEKPFWAEALQTATYVRNRVTSRSLPNDTTPFHRWHGKAPNLSHVRIFGSRCHYILPKSKVKSLDTRSREAIFVGYAQQSKGYKLWDVMSCKCVISRDVIFHEQEHLSNTVTADISIPSEDTLNQGGDTQVRSSSIPEKITESESPEPESDSDRDEDYQEVTPESTSTELRRGTRQRKPPSEWWKTTANIALSANIVPQSYKSATSLENIDFWTPGIDKEHDCLIRNKTWTLVDRTPCMHVLPCKYVFRVKNGAPKARLVALGCRQLYGIDYQETFAPVVKLTTIRVLLAIAAVLDFEIEQMDVVTAFLNGDLKEDIYMQVPEGLRSLENENKVCKLQKSLYGLKQAPRQWYAKIHDYLLTHLKFKSSSDDPCLYVRRTNSSITILALYVDDLLILGDSREEISSIKDEFSKRFEMKDLGPAKVMLGIEISRDRKNRKLFISQQQYIDEILKRFNMNESRTVTTPMEKSSLSELDIKDERAPENTPYRQAIGSLIYLVSGTRPDLAFCVRRLSQYLENPQKNHWTAVKRVLRYLKGTSRHGILYDGRLGTTLRGYADSDYAGCTKSRKSTSGYVFLIAGGAISWKSKKQSIVATSSCETEYVSSCMASKEAVWLARLCAALDPSHIKQPVEIKVDNNGAKDLAHNATINERTKHIDVQYHFVRQCIQDKSIILSRCDTSDQVADPLTKPLDRIAHSKHCSLQGLVENQTHDLLRSRGSVAISNLEKVMKY